MKRIFRKSKSKNTKNKYKYSNFRKNKKSSKKLKFTAHLKTMKKNVKYKHKRHIRHQKGGMLMSDMPDIWRFKNDDDFDSYRRYIFGSETRAQMWATILIECAKQRIPVFVITSGNRTAMERMFQLTETDKYIREVLSITRDDVSNPNPRFPELTKKGQVIDAILKELKIECVTGNIVGAFIDDQPGINFEDVPPCIEKIDALHPKINRSRYRPADSFENEKDKTTGKGNNIFYTDVFRHKNWSLNTNHINYIPEFILKTALWGISKTKIPEGALSVEYMNLVKMFQNIQVLFLDCDGTMSVLPEVYSFVKSYIDAHIKIIQNQHSLVESEEKSVESEEKSVESEEKSVESAESLLPSPLPTSLTTQEQ
jgi:hypothetical protein